MLSLAFIFALLLFVATVIDIFTKKVPSIFLTGLIFVLCIVNIQGIPFGIIAFIFALMLYESNFIGGVADIKFIVIMGLLIVNLKSLLVLFVLLVFFGVIYKAICVYILKMNKNELVAFLPCLFWVYVTMFAMGGFL